MYEKISMIATVAAHAWNPFAWPKRCRRIRKTPSTPHSGEWNATIRFIALETSVACCERELQHYPDRQRKMRRRRYTRNDPVSFAPGSFDITQKRCLT
jgi:hypothetical protein